MKHLCCLAALALAGNALAWGPEGHEIVGRIAETRLTPAALNAVNVLLNGSNQLATVRICDTDIANWADHVRRSRSESGPWHYVNIPYDATGYDAGRDCKARNGCVVDAIARFQKVLADPAAPQADRVEALKFLVHFAGDIHQPLHCGERNGDKGGNLCIVQWPGQSKPVKLHVVWDVNLLKRNLSDAHMMSLPYADRLNARITPEQAESWKAGNSADWAWESHTLVVTKVYATIPVDGPPSTLSDEYVKAGQKIVDEQLSKAGIRLAALLNEALK